MTKLSKTPSIGLFVTCLADLFRPSVAFATIKLLEEAGCTVAVPEQQTCCGQPAYNNGDIESTKAIAKQVIDAFQHYDYLIAPSGSCASIIKIHYVELFKDEPLWHEKAKNLANRSFEILSFLADVLKVELPNRSYAGVAAYHDGCSGLRELNIQQQPRHLLSTVKGLNLKELKEPDVCCGFGGTFCVKYPDISERMVSDKARNIQATGADMLLAGEMGCLLNIAGRLHRLEIPIRCFHAVEILAGMTELPAIGEPE